MRPILPAVFLAALVASPVAAGPARRPPTTEARRDARVVPTYQAGVLVGFKVFAIRRGTRFARAGVENGDRIEQIAGRAVATPEDARKLEHPGEIALVVVRRGERRLALTLPAER